MSLKQVNLLFLYSDSTNQSNIVKFLKTQCHILYEAHDLNIDFESFEALHMILVKELGDNDSLMKFAKRLSATHPHIPLLVIDKKQHIDAFDDALRQEINAFISLPIDKNTFVDILQENALQIQQNKHDVDALLSSVMTLQNNMFMLSKNNKIIFESPSLQECATKEEIQTIFSEYNELETCALDALKEDEFTLSVKHSEHEMFDTLVSLIPMVKDVQTSADAILSKEGFYEYLKHRLIHLEDHEAFALCDIQIVNHSELETSHGKAEVLESLHKLMHYILSLVPQAKISFWHQKSLLLSIDEDFETAKQTIISLQKSITQCDVCSDFDLKIIISMSTITQKNSINDCLDRIDILSSMSHNSRDDIYVASSYDDIDNDNRKVIAMLHDILDGGGIQSTLSLTSFYKGLVINNEITKASISEDGTLTIQTETIQCLAMSIEKTVLLHCALIPNDILCQVKVVNSRQQIAQVLDFKVLDTSYKQRKFSRLVPSKHTPATLIIDKITITGKVLDVSMNSISVFVTNKLIQNYRRDTILITSMNLVLAQQQRSESVRIKNRIINMFSDGDGFKVILGLESNDAHTIEMLGEYLRLRKKELVGELRKLLKVT